jgi:hypothetical protein
VTNFRTNLGTRVPYTWNTVYGCWWVIHRFEWDKKRENNVTTAPISLSVCSFPLHRIKCNRSNLRANTENYIQCSDFIGILFFFWMGWEAVLSHCGLYSAVWDNLECNVNTCTRKGVSKNFRTGSIKKCRLTKVNTRWEATQRVMAIELTRLTHNIAWQLHLVAENYNICSCRCRRPVRKLLDTPSCKYVYISFVNCWGRGGSAICADRRPSLRCVVKNLKWTPSKLRVTFQEHSLFDWLVTL